MTEVTLIRNEDLKIYLYMKDIHILHNIHSEVSPYDLLQEVFLILGQCHIS